MAFKTNMTSLQPRKQVYKREIQLMSRGFSAPKAWPNGKITVFPWDSDVDGLVTEHIKSAATTNLLYPILEKVCDLNGASVDDFVWGELNAVLLLSRALQYNGVFDYESQCPFCLNAVMETIKIPDDLAPVGEKPTNYPGYDVITLPDCKDVVRIRPLLVRDQKKIEERTKDPHWNTYSERLLQICLPVVAINDGPPDTLEQVVEWYNALSPNDCSYLEEQESDLNPHLENKIPHKCDKCQRKFYHTLTFDQQFFRPRNGGQRAPSMEKNISPGMGGK